MNILPKKKWHVRTKENVARVRRDQKKAAEEEQRVLERAQLAEQEYKVNLLRKNADERVLDLYGLERPQKADDKKEINIEDSSGHVNFFIDLEDEHRKNLGTGNKEYEEEKRREQREYESKVGILKYLAEGSNELTKQQSWYEKMPTRSDPKNEKKSTSSKGLPSGVRSLEDEQIRRKASKHKRKEEKKEKEAKRKRKHDKERRKEKRKRRSDDGELIWERSEDEKKQKNEMLEGLRAERLKREQDERRRAADLLNPRKEVAKVHTPVYSSQFNPEFARQNRRR